jgi:hypothetical protein
VENILQEEALGEVTTVPNFPRSNLPSNPSVSGLSQGEDRGSHIEGEEEEEDESNGDGDGDLDDFQIAEAALKKMAVQEKQQLPPAPSADEEDEELSLHK